MGSFNISCGITHQTIKPGDACVIIPILQVKSYNEVTLVVEDRETGILKEIKRRSSKGEGLGLEEFWEVDGPFLTADYDDYGGLSLHETPQNMLHLQKWFDSLVNEMIEVKEGESQYHEPAFDFKTIYNKDVNIKWNELHNIWDKWWDARGQQRTWKQNGAGEVLELQAAVMLQAAFDEIIRQQDSKVNYKNQSLSRVSVTSIWLNSLIKKAYRQLSRENELTEVIWDLIYNIRSFEGYPSERALLNKSGIEYVTPKEQELREQELTGILIAFFHQYPIESDLDPLTLNQLLYLQSDHVNNIYALTGLNHMHCRFMPLVLGGQDYDNSVGREYLNITEATHNALKEAREEDYDNEEKIGSNEIVEAVTERSILNQSESSKIDQEWSSALLVSDLSELKRLAVLPNLNVMTAYGLSVRSGNIKALQCLHDGHRALVDSDAKMLLNQAIYWGNPNVVSWMEEHWLITLAPESKILLAVKGGSLPMVQYLAQSCSREDWSWVNESGIEAIRAGSKSNEILFWLVNNFKVDFTLLISAATDLDRETSNIREVILPYIEAQKEKLDLKSTLGSNVVQVSSTRSRF